MNDWHAAQDLRPKRGVGRYEEPLHYIRWCFAERRHAEAFAAEFGGELLPPPPIPEDPWEAVQWAKKYIQDP